MMATSLKQQLFMANYKERSLLYQLLPKDLRNLGDLSNEIPKLAKDAAFLGRINSIVAQVPTRHELRLGDARSFSSLPDCSVHLVLTSPPYWTLKEYAGSAGQIGHIADYTEFLKQLDCVWRECFRVLVPGGRLVCVVGDVCLSRRRNEGRHTVVPLHASIQTNCRDIGFDNLSPIIWHKIANANYEAKGNGGGFLGKPYEPNAVIKNDIEFILMQRKSGGYRTPDYAARLLSIISEESYRLWFQQIWTGLTGASTKFHPAPFPLELADRLIRMFSFVGDVVLDPFLGSGTTSVAAARAARNSIGIEVEPAYLKPAAERIRRETSSLFGSINVFTEGV